MRCAMDGATQAELVLQHLPLCKKIAYRFARRLPPSVDVQDLIQAGVMGLYEATRLYDPEIGPFAPYASSRIRGAILDELRKEDSLGRRTRLRAKAAEQCKEKLANQLGRLPTQQEIADELGIRLDAYIKLVNRGSAPLIVAIEDFYSEAGAEPEDFAAVDQGDVLDRLHHGSVGKRLQQAIGGLQERQRFVITEVYLRGRTLADVGAQLGLSESRTCTICSEAIVILRRKMKDLG